MSTTHNNETRTTEGGTMKKAYTVTVSDHDMGAKGHTFKKESREDAEWTANLMRDCGYRAIEINEV